METLKDKKIAKLEELVRYLKGNPRWYGKESELEEEIRALNEQIDTAPTETMCPICNSIVMEKCIYRGNKCTACLEIDTAPTDEDILNWAKSDIILNSNCKTQEDFQINSSKSFIIEGRLQGAKAMRDGKISSNPPEQTDKE